MTIAATGNAMVLVASRVLFAMARDGHLPASLAQVQPRTHAPVASVVVCGAALALVAGVSFGGHVELLAGASGLLYVLHYLPPLVGLALLRRREPEVPRRAFRMPAPRVVLPASIGCCIGVALASGRASIVLGGAWLLLGAAAPILRSRHGRTRRAGAQPTTDAGHAVATAGRRSGAGLVIGQQPDGPAVAPDDDGERALLGAHPLVDVRQRLVAARSRRIAAEDRPDRRRDGVEPVRERPRDIRR